MDNAGRKVAFAERTPTQFVTRKPAHVSRTMFLAKYGKLNGCVSSSLIACWLPGRYKIKEETI